MAALPGIWRQDEKEIIFRVIRVLDTLSADGKFQLKHTLVYSIDTLPSRNNIDDYRISFFVSGGQNYQPAQASFSRNPVSCIYSLIY